jgi:hypothetical protein
MPAPVGRVLSWSPARQGRHHHRPVSHLKACHVNRASMSNPMLTVRLARGTWEHNPNAIRRTHARADTTTRSHTAAPLWGEGQRRLGAACMSPNNCRPSQHRAAFLGTQLRSCVSLPPSRPPARRRLNSTLPKAARKRPQVVAGQHNLTSPSRTPRRAPRAVRRGASSVLSGLQLWSTSMTTMIQKQTALTWGTS